MSRLVWYLTLDLSGMTYRVVGVDCVTATEKILMAKPNNTLPDPVIAPQDSEVVLATTTPTRKAIDFWHRFTYL